MAKHKDSITRGVGVPTMAKHKASITRGGGYQPWLNTRLV